jgi:hypothetical protein
VRLGRLTVEEKEEKKRGEKRRRRSEVGQKRGERKEE